MMKYIVIIGLLFPFGIAAQTISGKVTNNKKEPLVGANVYWQGTAVGVITGDDGEFEIPLENISDKSLVASYIGYTSDTMAVTNQVSIDFKLIAENSLKEVVVKGQRDGIITSSIDAIKTEQITQTELKKAACCDLAGCFSTQSSVHPQTTNVITNSKELRILGLSGGYNQVLINGLPMIQGLSFTYGISSIPGTLVDDIFIAKGANSVLQGYESISGQINVTTKDPEAADKLLLNVYLNSFLEKHFNANYAFKKGKWSNLTAIHAVLPANRRDRDKDDFLDLPLLSRYSLANTWKYGNEGEWGWSSKIGIRLLHEKRIGGQFGFDPETDKGSAEVYGQTVNLNQPEFWTKSAYRFDDIHSIVFQASTFHQNQQSYFGTVDYQAQQTNFYGNLQYELNYSNHGLKTGLSFRYLNLNEDIAFTNNTLLRTYDGNYLRKEIIPGLFAENTMSFLANKLTWIVGVRGDHHNTFGTIFTPRTLLKYNIGLQSTIRANIGTGWRTANLFCENINLLVSSRDIIFEEELQAEEAVNYGFNFTQKFEAKHLSGSLSTDYYRTEFQNQIFPDYDTDPTKAIIKNYTGTSVGNGFQLELYARLYEQFEFKAGYNYLDVYRKTSEGKEVLPFNSKHKILTTFSYKPLSKKFHFDVNAHWSGRQRLPDTKSNPIAFQRPDFSQPFIVVNSQFTYNFKTMEVYTGCENIFDFRQTRPILSWQNPFGPYFDTSSVWGPIRGREFYLGVRYYLRDKV
jgi:outer membrane receptor for ferrienterochelin and colicin